MNINEEILNEILQKRQRTPKGEKREKILKLKEEIIALKERGLKATEIVEYLKRAHRIKVDVTYLRKLIPELADKAGAIANIIGKKETKESILRHLVGAAERLGIDKKEMALELLKKLSDEEVAEIWNELGTERLKSITAIYKTKYRQPRQEPWNRSFDYQL